MGYMSELESSSGERMDAKVPRTAKPGETLEVRYDLERVKREVSPRDIEQGPANLWRYAPLLPVQDAKHVISLNEGYTPLLQTPRLALKLGLKTLSVKDEG